MPSPSTEPGTDDWLQDYDRATAVAPLIKRPTAALVAAEPVVPTRKEVKRDMREELEIPPEAKTEKAIRKSKDFRLMRADDWLALGLDVVNGKPIDNINNASLLLAHLYTGEIWYDEFLKRILTSTGSEQCREWEGADDIRLTIRMQRECGVSKISKRSVHDAVVEHAYKDTRNELKSYLTGLKWDGIERIKFFFSDVCGSEDNVYTQSVGKNFFVGMVARAMRPGCKLDTMVVLEGRQGIRKSTLLEVLGGKWYSVMRDAPESKDFGIVLQGKWLIEIAELDAFSRSDVKATKRTLSTACDRYRKPYGIDAEDHPRMSVFAGTTNRDDYLDDPTGARRFYPIECGTINLETARQNRDQYFAEAMHMLNEGADWWKMPAEESRLERAKREQGDVWDAPVAHAIKGLVTITTEKVLSELGIETGRQTRADQMRVGACMRRLGFVRERVWIDRRPFWKWVRDRSVETLNGGPADGQQVIEESVIADHEDRM